MNIAASGLVFDQFGNVLLIQRDDTRTFAPPSGSLDAFELPDAACAREVREETGIIVHPVRLVGLHYQDSTPDGMLILTFRCIQRGGEIKPSPESPVVGWFKAVDLPRPMFGMHRERIEMTYRHAGGPPVWERYRLSLGERIGRFLLFNVVYRWKNWRRKVNGEPDYVRPPGWKVGAFVVIKNEAGAVLWVKRTDGDVWNLPGGGGEPHETPWETAVRETYEETGLNVKLTDLSSINVYENSNEMCFTFTATIENGTLTTGAEAADFAYFQPGEEPANCILQHIERVQDTLQENTIFRKQPGPQALFPLK